MLVMGWRPVQMSDSRYFGHKAQTRLSRSLFFVAIGSSHDQSL